MASYTESNPKIKKLIELLKRLDKQPKGEEKAINVLREWQKKHKTNIAHVVSAVPLKEAQLKQIEKRLGLMMKDKVIAVNKVDKNILGGLKIIINSKIIDTSLSAKLRQFTKNTKQYND